MEHESEPEYKEIELTQSHVTIVDAEDYEWLNNWKWHVLKERYTCYAYRSQYTGMVEGKVKLKTIFMHRLIMDCPDKMVVDHRNGDGLDNRKCNLRVVTRRQNGQNRRDNSSSKYPGVSWHKGTQKWGAYIQINNKKKHLGVFKEERDAAKAYELACRELVGEELICKIKSIC